MKAHRRYNIILTEKNYNEYAKKILQIFFTQSNSDGLSNSKYKMLKVFSPLSYVELQPKNSYINWIVDKWAS